MIHKNFPMKHLIKKQKIKQNLEGNVKACAFVIKKIFGIRKKKNVVDMDSWKKCDHCKKHHKLYLNYNSENNSSSWADMVEKKLKWDKQQNMDDENQKTTHNIES